MIWKLKNHSIKIQCLLLRETLLLMTISTSKTLTATFWLIIKDNPGKYIYKEKFHSRNTVLQKNAWSKQQTINKIIKREFLLVISIHNSKTENLLSLLSHLRVKRGFCQEGRLHLFVVLVLRVRGNSITLLSKRSHHQTANAFYNEAIILKY